MVFALSHFFIKRRTSFNFIFISSFVFALIFFTKMSSSSAFNAQEMNLPNIDLLKLENGLPLRILTFNIWLSGAEVENGLYKIAKHINILQPDIVALQEVKTAEIFQKLLDKLGMQWSGVISHFPYPDNAIITTHTIDTTSKATTPSNIGVGVNIQLRNSNQIISLWSLHFAWKSYGPYAANNKQVTKLEQILSGEAPKAKNGRQDNALELLDTPEFIKAVENSDKNPIIVCGDFNCPSHLDWIEETKHLHGGWVVPWPATKLLQTKAGLIDSYREIFPNPLKNPGITWSNVNCASGAEWDYTIPEPLDRIDFIFYKGSKLQPINSFIYAGNEPLKHIPDHGSNDYPSDHFSVITDFSLDLK